MARILTILAAISALTVSFSCARSHGHAAYLSDIDKAWEALRRRHRETRLVLHGEALDISKIHSFVVVKPSPNQSIGIMSGDLSGSILLFDRDGMLLASHRTGSIRNFQLPDPGVLNEEMDVSMVGPIDRIFLTEGSLVGSGPKTFSIHLYRIGPSSIRELWKTESYVEADNGEMTIEHKIANVIDDTTHEADNRQFLLVGSDLLRGTVASWHCRIAPDDSVACDPAGKG